MELYDPYGFLDPFAFPELSFSETIVYLEVIFWERDASFLLTVEVFLLTARLFFLRLFAWVCFAYG